MKTLKIPTLVNNYIAGSFRSASDSSVFHKLNPATGGPICEVANSPKEDVDQAVQAAQAAQQGWANTPGVQRGEILFSIARAMEDRREEIASIVSLETGKSKKDALGETNGAIQLARFYAGEGQRLYARTTTSGIANKKAMTIREPIGVAALIISANTPIANIAWKLFPALICGNGVVLKASADAPLTSWIMTTIIQESALPVGLVNIVHGHGSKTGAAIVEHPDIHLISFTGSTEVGKYIMRTAGPRLTKISLELGGKNPFIVCDDADIDNAVHWAVLSAFSNAGQRCASGSRIIVFKSIYEEFKNKFVTATQKLSIGTKDTDDLGPVINEKQLNNMITAVSRAKERGAHILTGGGRMTDPEHREGFYMSPTVIENVPSNDELSTTELFGPIPVLYKVQNYNEAITLANDSPYGLTAAIHTRNTNRAQTFITQIQSGVAVINGGTFGSEPHMPFGGVKQSGNGTREPGTEALDIYSNLKDVYQIVDPAAV